MSAVFRCRTRDLAVPVASPTSIGNDCALFGPVELTPPNESGELPVYECVPEECRAPLEITKLPTAFADVLAQHRSDSRWNIESSTDEWLHRSRPTIILHGVYDDPVMGLSLRRVVLVDLGTETLVVSASERFTGEGQAPVAFEDTLYRLQIAFAVAGGIDAATAEDFANGCPEFGDARIVDLDNDGIDEMIQPVAALTSPVRTFLTTFYRAGPDCVWEPTESATGLPSLDGNSWGCRRGSDDIIELVDWSDAPLAADLDGRRVSEAQGSIPMANGQVSRLIASEWVDGPRDYAPEATMPNGLETCINPDQAEVADLTDLAGPPEQPSCPAPNAAGLGPSIYVDLDADGRSEALVPDSLEQRSLGFQLTHLVLTQQGECDWRAISRIAQVQGPGQPDHRWGCHPHTGGLALVVIAATRSAGSYSEYGEVVALELMGDRLVETNRFVYDHDSMETLATLGCDRTALQPGDFELPSPTRPAPESSELRPVELVCVTHDGTDSGLWAEEPPTRTNNSSC